MKNLSRPSVLVAIADAKERATIGALSVEAGFPTISVPSGASALQTFESSPTQIVVTDWLTPSVDGFALCQRIREIAGDECIVMVLSSRDSSDDLIRALAGGVDEFVMTPVVPGHFRARLFIADRLLAAARSRRAAELETARLRWLAGIGQVALTFRHEINNPLTALYGHLEMLERNATLDTVAIRDVANAVTQARRIETTVTLLGSADSAIITPATASTQSCNEQVTAPEGR